MAPPSQYSSKLSIPLPSEETVSKLIGEAYDPTKTLNVIKMFAGTGDMFPATIGFVKALFHTAGIDPKTREIIALRSAKVLNSRYEWQANALAG
jgi:alkylhydroperoxidase family enzyme